MLVLLSFVWGCTWPAMRIALSEMVIEGVKTNIPLHQELMIDSAFVRGGTSIHYLEERLAKLKK